MWFWTAKGIDEVRRSRINQFDFFETTIPELKDDGRWSEFWQVFRIQGPKWIAFNNWLKDTRAQQFDVHNGEQEAWKRTREWKTFLGRNGKELLAECPVVV